MLSDFGSGRQKQHKYYQYGSQVYNEPIVFHPAPSQLQTIEEKTNRGYGRARILELFSDTAPIDISYNELNVINESDDDYKVTFSFKRLLKFAGPGWLMSIAYIDSGNLESDIQSGSIAGYSLIWILFWSTFVGWLLQSLCARLAVVTGQNLAELCRFEYNNYISILLWLIMESAIIGSDIQQVLGTAIAFRILFGIDLWIGCILTAFLAFILLAVNHYQGLRCMEYFFASMILSMVLLFIVLCIISEPNFWSMLYGWVVPWVNDAKNVEVQEQSIGIIGATIMPFNLFLHSSLVQLRNISRTNKNAIKEANYYFTLEAGLSLLVSFLINICVVSVFSVGFFGNEEYNMSMAGLLTADSFLLTRFGTASKYIWAIGLLASGQSATMTGTFAGQYVMNGFLNLQWQPWMRTILTRSIALFPALIVAIVAAEQFDTVNEWLNIHQCIILPFALLPLLFFSCNTRIMGNLFVLSLKLQIIYAFIGFIVVMSNVVLVALFIVAWDTGDNLTLFASKWFILSSFLWIYLGIVGWLLYDFCKQKSWKLQNDFDIDNTLMHVNNNKNIGDDDDDDEQENIELTQDSQPLLAGNK